MNDTGTCAVCGGRLRADNRAGICQRTKACKAAHWKARYDASRDAPPPCQACGKPLNVRRPGVRFHIACRDDPVYGAVVKATENAEERVRRQATAEARRQAAQLAAAGAALSALSVAEVETATRRRDDLLGRLAAALAALEAAQRAKARRQRAARAAARQRERYAARRPAGQDSDAAVEAARQWRERYEADRRRRGVPEDGLPAKAVAINA